MHFALTTASPQKTYDCIDFISAFRPHAYVVNTTVNNGFACREPLWMILQGLIFTLIWNAPQQCERVMRRNFK